MTARWTYLLLPVLLCGCSEDIAALLVGDYTGDLVTQMLIVDDANVTIARVDNDTVSVSGDFDSFEVDLLRAGDALVTSTPDAAAQLSWMDGVLQFTTAEVQFDGTSSSGEAPLTSTGTPTEPQPGPTSPQTVAERAAGTYVGQVAGPVNALDYTLLLVVSGPNSVMVSGDGIQDFEIPLEDDMAEIREAATWSEGSFIWTDGMLELSHTQQGLSFSGDQNG